MKLAWIVVLEYCGKEIVNRGRARDCGRAGAGGGL